MWYQSDPASIVYNIRKNGVYTNQKKKSLYIIKIDTLFKTGVEIKFYLEMYWNNNYLGQVLGK